MSVIPELVHKQMSFQQLYIFQFLLLCFLQVWSGRNPVFPAHSLSGGCNNNIELLSETMELFLSADSGLSWTHSSLPANKSIMSYVASCDKRDKASVSIIGSNGHEIFLSKNYGDDWLQLPAPNEIWLSFAADEKTRYLYAIAMRKGIYVSSDGGMTWALTHGTDSRMWKKVVCDRRGEISLSISLTGELIISKEYGKEYTTVPFFATNSINWMDIAINQNGNVIIVADLHKIYMSLNRGVTWNDLAIMEDKRDIVSRQWRNVYCSPFGNFVAAISVDGRLFISIDYGNTWRIAADIIEERWSTVTIDATGSLLYASTDKALYVTNDHGITWKNVIPTKNTRSMNAITKQTAKMEESLFTFNDLVGLGASIQPSMEPTLTPSTMPSYEPSRIASTQPSVVPTLSPSLTQTITPTTIIPSASPSCEPTVIPTSVRTNEPTMPPSISTSPSPSIISSRAPTLKPTRRPTVQQTTSSPTRSLESFYPTLAPTVQVYPVFTMETYLSIGNVYGTVLTPAAVDALLTTFSTILQISKDYLYYLGIRSVLRSTIMQSSLRSNHWSTAGTNISYSLVAVTRIEIPLVMYATTHQQTQLSSQNFTQEIFRNLSSALTKSIATNEFVNMLQYQAQLSNATDFDFVHIQKVNFTATTVLPPPTLPPAFGSHGRDNSLASNIGAIFGIVLGCIVIIVAVLFYYRKKIRKMWRKGVKRHAQIMSLEDLGLQRHDPVEFYQIQHSPSKQFMAADSFEDVYNAEQRPKKSKSMTKKLQKMAQEEQNLDKIPSSFMNIKMKPHGKELKYLADDLSPSRAPPPLPHITVEQTEVVLGLDEDGGHLIVDVDHDPFAVNLPQSPLSASLKKSIALVNPKTDEIDILL